jgi:hypothetical protein
MLSIDNGGFEGAEYSLQSKDGGVKLRRPRPLFPPLLAKERGIGGEVKGDFNHESKRYPTRKGS